MSRDVAPIFAAIDAMDAEKFNSYLTPDVRFRFANLDPAIGHAAVKAGVEGFWATIGGLTHHIQRSWDFGDTTIVQIDVEYQRKDGKTVITPNADILIFEGDLVKDWQIYIDVAPVYAP
jgi:ketosteroid isomerase-like protein